MGDGRYTVFVHTQIQRCSYTRAPQGEPCLAGNHHLPGFVDYLFPLTIWVNILDILYIQIDCEPTNGCVTFLGKNTNL